MAINENYNFNLEIVSLKNAFFSRYSPGTPTNYSTHMLFNSSVGDRIIAIRGVSLTNTQGLVGSRCFRQTATIGTHLGTEAPLWAGEPQGAGQHWYADQAQITTYDFLACIGNPTNYGFSGNGFFGVLPPGWGFILQCGTSATAIAMTFYWEELPADLTRQPN